MSDYSKLSKIIIEKENKFFETLSDEQKKCYNEIIYLMNKKMYILLTDSFDEDVKLSRKILIKLIEEDF